jgi:hypothetical protein
MAEEVGQQTVRVSSFDPPMDNILDSAINYALSNQEHIIENLNTKGWFQMTAEISRLVSTGPSTAHP